MIIFKPFPKLRTYSIAFIILFQTTNCFDFCLSRGREIFANLHHHFFFCIFFLFLTRPFFLSLPFLCISPSPPDFPSSFPNRSHHLLAGFWLLLASHSRAHSHWQIGRCVPYHLVPPPR